MYTSFKPLQAQGVEPLGSLALSVTFGQVTGTVVLADEKKTPIETFQLYAVLDAKSMSTEVANSYETTKAIYNAFGAVARGTVVDSKGASYPVDLFMHANKSNVGEFTAFNLLFNKTYVRDALKVPFMRFSGVVYIFDTTNFVTATDMQLHLALAKKSKGINCY